MNTHKRIDYIAEHLREIYKNDNDGPRLIAEMVEREFPYPRKVWNDNPDDRNGIRGGWGMLATSNAR